MADSLMKNSVTGTFFRTMKFVPEHLLFGTTFCYQFWAFYSAFTKNNFQNAFSHLIFLILHIDHLIEKLYQISQVFSSYFFFLPSIYIYIWLELPLKRGRARYVLIIQYVFWKSYIHSVYALCPGILFYKYLLGDTYQCVPRSCLIFSPCPFFSILVQTTKSS